jgi:DNA-binding FadR family transcriptional regulator
MVLAGRTHHHLMPTRPKPGAISLHEDVARAVRTGDSAAAEQAMRAIIDEAAAAMREDRAADPGSANVRRRDHLILRGKTGVME